MFTMLDLLVVVCMGIAALTLLSLCLMFFLKNKLAKRICLYVVSVIAMYMSGVGIYIGLFGWFPGQAAVGVAMMALAIGAVVLDIFSRGDDKRQLIARIAGSVALIVGFANAVLF